MANIEPERRLVNFLRNQLIDLNTSRTGQWIYEDFPITTLSDDSYPRVTVTKITESGEPLGIFIDDTFDNILFQIDVFVKKDIVYSYTVSNESVGEISNDLSLDYVPTTVTAIAHDAVAFATVTFVATDDDFTTPLPNTVQVSRSSGNLRFNSTDLTTYAGETITASYVVKLSNDNAAKWIARDIVNNMRQEWRSNRGVLGQMFYPIVQQNFNNGFDESRRSFRRTITCEWNVINAGQE